MTKDVSEFLADLKTGGKPKPHKNTEKQHNSVKDAKKPKDKKAKALKPEASEKKPIIAPALPPPLPVGNKSNGKMIFPANAHWYSALAPLAPSKTPLVTPTASQVSSLSERASSLLTADASTYQASAAFAGNSASDSHFLSTILSKGTLSDRLSALTLLVQASPVHNTKALESLKVMAERGRGKGGREEGLKAMRCVVDWWVGGGAPARKLK